MSPVAVYVHIPFCPTKCGYCDFNSYAGYGEEVVERTVAATISEILGSPWRGRPAKTIFFGGGTPTYLTAAQELSILEAVMEVHPPAETVASPEDAVAASRRALHPQPPPLASERRGLGPVEGCEITTEANPGTADASKFRDLREGGFNRISLGAQSFRNDDLIRLGRIHAGDEIWRAVTLAREAGFENLNLDLMFGLPGQGTRGWKENLERALALGPDHLSLYGLTIEPGTQFFKDRQHGRLVLPEEEIQVEMYQMALEAALGAGMVQYEISNFARPGYECRHNLEYWRLGDYAGYGPGAVGCVDGVRRTNWKLPTRYADAVEAGEPAYFEAETLTPESRRIEAVMLGLRLNEGFLPGDLALDPAGTGDMVNRGWLAQDGERLKLTEAGRHFASEVALALI